MFQRSLYQAALVVLAVLTAAGTLWLVLDPSSSPGVEVSIPSQAAASTPAPDTVQAVAAPPSGLVNLNTATVRELEPLPKIGPVLAQRIVDYRESHGPFQRADQVTAVAGVGPAVYEAIRHLVTVGE
jgi:competence protein ComEA